MIDLEIPKINTWNCNRLNPKIIEVYNLWQNFYCDLVSGDLYFKS